jgi:outer membrane protein
MRKQGLNKLLAGSVLALLSAVTLSCADAQSLRIGIVNIQAVAEQAPSIKKLGGDLEQKFAPEQDKLKKLYQSFQDDLNKLKKNQSVMSKKDIAALQDKIQGEQDSLTQAQAQFQKELGEAQKSQMMTVMAAVKGAAAKAAQSKNIDLVLPAEAVLYSKQGVVIDLSSDVINGLK